MDRSNLSKALSNAQEQRAEREQANAEAHRDVAERTEVGLPTGVNVGSVERRWDLSERDVEGIKHTYVSSGGNLSLTAKESGLSPHEVKMLALERAWRLYGEPVEQSVNATQSQLAQRKDRMWSRFDEMMDSLVVETKHPDEVADKQRGSIYSAPLAQRSQAAKTLFEQAMRLEHILNPEAVEGDPEASNNQRHGQTTSADEASARLQVFVENLTVKADEQGDTPADMIDVTNVSKALQERGG